MDVYWAVYGNASPAEYFNKYPGRWKVLHIKDKKEIG
jgi:sugar phosphate isomerase/epimerase